MSPLRAAVWVLFLLNHLDGEMRRGGSPEESQRGVSGVRTGEAGLAECGDVWCSGSVCFDLLRGAHPQPGRGPISCSHERDDEGRDQPGWTARGRQDSVLCGWQRGLRTKGSILLRPPRHFALQNFLEFRQSQARALNYLRLIYHTRERRFKLDIKL